MLLSVFQYPASEMHQWNFTQGKTSRNASIRVRWRATVDRELSSWNISQIFKFFDFFEVLKRQGDVVESLKETLAPIVVDRERGVEIIAIADRLIFKVDD